MVDKECDRHRGQRFLRNKLKDGLNPSNEWQVIPLLSAGRKKLDEEDLTSDLEGGQGA